MWRIRRRCSLVALLPKLSSTKTIWPVTCRLRDFQAGELVLFFSAHMPVNDFYFLVKSHELMQLHTYHSLDFVRKLKMFKITAYIHLYYKIPF